MSNIRFFTYVTSLPVVKVTAMRRDVGGVADAGRDMSRHGK